MTHSLISIPSGIALHLSTDDGDGPRMSIHRTNTSVLFSAEGGQYEVGCGWSREFVEIELDSKDVEAVHDYLGAVLEAQELKRIDTTLERLSKLPRINDVKPRVYKRKANDPNIEQFSAKRPWVCTGVFEDGRKSCYVTWEDAIGWALMPGDKRQEQLNYDAQFEMGQ